MTPTLTKPPQTKPPQTQLTVGDLHDQFGPMPLDRIRFEPWPGTATEEDVLDIHRREKRLCEFVHGVFVEKAMGNPESFLTIALAAFLREWVQPRRLGKISGADGTLRFAPGLVRIPDVAFISWDRIPNRRTPKDPMPDLVPDLAAEVLSPSNTEREMTNKIRDYFRTGVRLVWVIDPQARTVAVYTSPNHSVTLTADQTLDGGDVLPGFTLPLKELFAELDEEGPPPAAK